jgi:hypothetical protein
VDNTLTVVDRTLTSVGDKITVVDNTPTVVDNTPTVVDNTLIVVDSTVTALGNTLNTVADKYVCNISLHKSCFSSIRLRDTINPYEHNLNVDHLHENLRFFTKTFEQMDSKGK